LRQNAGANIRVFVVWEPVISTDWGPPSPTLPGQVNDARVRHYWDPDHMVSARLGGVGRLESMARERQIGFRMKDVLWDAALVYSPGAVLSSAADLLVAPVVKFEAPLAAAIR
jgi:hypothetical protein